MMMFVVLLFAAALTSTAAGQQVYSTDDEGIVVEGKTITLKDGTAGEIVVNTLNNQVSKNTDDIGGLDTRVQRAETSSSNVETAVGTADEDSPGTLFSKLEDALGSIYTIEEEQITASGTLNTLLGSSKAMAASLGSLGCHSVASYVAVANSSEELPFGADAIVNGGSSTDFYVLGRDFSPRARYSAKFIIDEDVVATSQCTRVSSDQLSCPIALVQNPQTQSFTVRVELMESRGSNTDVVRFVGKDDSSREISMISAAPTIRLDRPLYSYTGGTLLVTATVDDVDHDLDRLTVTVTSKDTSIIPNSAISSAVDRQGKLTIKISKGPSSTQEVVVEIVATDSGDGAKTTATFKVIRGCSPYPTSSGVSKVPNHCDTAICMLQCDDSSKSPSGGPINVAPENAIAVGSGGGSSNWPITWLFNGEARSDPLDRDERYVAYCGSQDCFVMIDLQDEFYVDQINYWNGVGDDRNAYRLAPHIFQVWKGNGYEGAVPPTNRAERSAMNFYNAGWEDIPETKSASGNDFTHDLTSLYGKANRYFRFYVYSPGGNHYIRGFEMQFNVQAHTQRSFCDKGSWNNTVSCA